MSNYSFKEVQLKVIWVNKLEWAVKIPMHPGNLFPSTSWKTTMVPSLHWNCTDEHFATWMCEQAPNAIIVWWLRLLCLFRHEVQMKS